MMYGVGAMASDTEDTQLYLYRKNPPPIDGMMRPSKAPSRKTPPLVVSLNLVESCIILDGVDGCQISYVVSDECGVVICQGIVNEELQIIYMGSLMPGYYMVSLEINGTLYDGCFVVEEYTEMSNL